MEMILIACCKTKEVGGALGYQPSGLTSSLSKFNHSRLLAARNILRGELGLVEGPDLGGDVSDIPVEYLPAFRRYTGIVFKQSNFADLYPKTKGLKVVIISALYGLLDADDLIREYELAMKMRLPSNLVKTWWKQRLLGLIVAQHIQALKPTVVHDLLPGDYRNALRPWPPVSLKPIIKTYAYPGLGTGSIYHRARDVKAILTDHIR